MPKLTAKALENIPAKINVLLRQLWANCVVLLFGCGEIEKKENETRYRIEIEDRVSKQQKRERERERWNRNSEMGDMESMKEIVV